MFRRLIYTLLFLGFLAVAAVSAYLLYGRWLAWQACADAWGRCHDAATGAPLFEPTGIALAYASATLVLVLLTLWSLAGMFRSRRHHAHA